MDISDKTKIPLFVVVAALPVLFGFVFWLSSIYAAVSTAQDINLKQDIKIDQLYTLLIDIRDRLVRIEEQNKNKRVRGDEDERN
jgi:hypothetical protein